MRKPDFRLFILPVAILTAVLFIYACGTKRPTGFELQSQAWDREEDDSVTKIYLTGTKPIDSIDVNKLIYDIWRIEIDEYPDNLKVYARVYDSLGNFVTNMANPYKKNDSITYFTDVTEWLGKTYRRREAKVEYFNVREYGANDSIPYNIVLSVDYSGSMNGVMDAIYEGTELFVGMKMKYDNIGLTTFNKDFEIKVPMMNSGDTILNIYRTNRQNGFGLFTAVYDALWNAIDLFKYASKTDPRVLVIFSDGDDNYSKQEIADVYRKAKDEKINVFAVAFGYSKDDNLRELARYTGGKFYKAYTKQELIAIFRDIYMSLRYYYYITYTPPKYWGWHEVYSTVEVPGRDSLVAFGEYGTADMALPWNQIGDAFKKKIMFDFDSATVKPVSYPILDEIVDILLTMPKIRLEIQGHTDNVGTREYNQDLSDRRASAVKYEMVKRGVEEYRLRPRGFGFSQPDTTNDTEENRARNRRTVFKIIAK